MTFSMSDNSSYHAQPHPIFALISTKVIGIERAFLLVSECVCTVVNF